MPCCGGNCGACSGCSRALELTELEISLLQRLGEVAFLPVCREAGAEEPQSPEEQEAFWSLAVQCLEKKGLVSLDYTRPLKGYHSERYDHSTHRGSIALTQRGQQVLELLEIQGIN